ncbi:ankyrin repeat domain-containing protein 37 [Pelodytes ibericus]
MEQLHYGTSSCECSMCSLFEYVRRGVAKSQFIYTADDSLSKLMESGCAVNSPADTLGQSPVHMAACGREAFFLLWQLQTGVDINQQDFFGEAPIHKAARSGSLECISLLVAREARLDLCNKDGHTPEDLAISGGFLECAKYLATVIHTQNIFSRAQSTIQEISGTAAATKRSQSCQSIAYGKRRRSDGFI